MHKKIIFIVLGFFILNIFSINAFYDNYIGKDLYNKKDYINSIKYFQKAGDKHGYYNVANSFYKQKKYKEAIKEYKSLLTDEKNEINFNINHNIANSFYRIGELENNNAKKIKNREESIKYYSSALNIKYDEETKKNLEFVLNKIKKEKEQNSQKSENSKDGKNDKKQDSKGGNQSEKQDSNGNSEKGDQNKESNEGEKGNEKDGNKKNNGDKGSNDNEEKGTSGDKGEKKDGKEGENNQKQEGKKGEESNQLTNEQEQALKQYEQALKEEQKNNANNFNKVYKENNSNDPFANFFNDPFFNNNLLNGGSGEKDW